jgi:mono/diheme cytochrome c family protein
MTKPVKTIVVIFGLVSIVIVGYNFFEKAKAENSLVLGEKVFKANCAGCHFNGLNAIKKDKPVIGSSKLASPGAFKAFLNNPPPPMPKYPNLTADAVQFGAIYTYLQTLKK